MVSRSAFPLDLIRSVHQNLISASHWIRWDDFLQQSVARRSGQSEDSLLDMKSGNMRAHGSLGINGTHMSHNVFIYPGSSWIRHITHAFAFVWGRACSAERRKKESVTCDVKRLRRTVTMNRWSRIKDAKTKDWIGEVFPRSHFRL